MKQIKIDEHKIKVKQGSIGVCGKSIRESLVLEAPESRERNPNLSWKDYSWLYQQDS